MWTQVIFHCCEFYRSVRYGRINPNADTGQRGEQAAARYLRQRGLVIVSENEADRAGEIDLIAMDPRNRTVVFIEVKTHGSSKPGHPAERVGSQKQGRITRAASRYLKRKRLLGVPVRFDVVAIWWPNGLTAPTKIKHYESAFDAVGEYQFYS